MTENLEAEELKFVCAPEILAGIDDYAFAFDLGSRAEAITQLLRAGISAEQRLTPELRGNRVRMATRLSQAMARKIGIAAAANDRPMPDEIVVRLHEASGKAVATAGEVFNRGQPYVWFKVPIEFLFELDGDAKAAGRSLHSEVISRLEWTLRDARAG